MKALRTVVIALALVVPAAPAHAALIGLLGGNYDPPPITDPGPFGFEQCSNQFDPRFTVDDFCVFYNAFDQDPNFPDFEPFDNIFSLDFLLARSGIFLSAGENLEVHPLSDLRILQNSDEFNPNGLSLSGGTITKGAVIPFPYYECEGEFCESPTITVTGVALILRLGSGDGAFGDYLTSNLAVNGIPVPEPGTLLLLGPAAAALLMRRARAGRRRNQRTE